ncbi:thioredoxin [Calorimonas adulescens]|jgi:thioredoxin|uniref:Thioredoxin n=1 Tax=Calorimonas adulescens TaxID=2606906 RepID=A0A5D8Q8Y7_9THEO|nr:thioredoxin [Calorimonas adulescens]TZE80952.1 thioredoxin [Calorimonas adulescens]
MIKTVSDSNFSSEVFIKDKAVLVDFWAPWCAPCRLTAPVLEEFDRRHGDKIKVTKLNVDENPLIATTYNVMSIPTLAVFVNGALVDRVVGYMPIEKLEEKLSRYIKESKDNV